MPISILHLSRNLSKDRIAKLHSCRMTNSGLSNLTEFTALLERKDHSSSCSEDVFTPHFKRMQYQTLRSFFLWHISSAYIWMITSRLFIWDSYCSLSYLNLTIFKIFISFIKEKKKRQEKPDNRGLKPEKSPKGKNP